MPPYCEKHGRWFERIRFYGIVCADCIRNVPASAQPPLAAPKNPSGPAVRPPGNPE